MRTIWNDAENQREWFAIIAGATLKHEGGAFWQELIDHHLEVDGTLNGVVIDPLDPRPLKKPLNVEIALFEKWGLLSHEEVTPRSGAFTPKLHIPLLDEPQWKLTSKGEKLLKRSHRRQQVAFVRMLIWLEATHIRRVIRVAIVSISPIFAFLKLVLLWETEKALIGATMAGVVGVLVSLFPRQT